MSFQVVSHGWNSVVFFRLLGLRRNTFGLKENQRDLTCGAGHHPFVTISKHDFGNCQLFCTAVENHVGPKGKRNNIRCLPNLIYKMLKRMMFFLSLDCSLPRSVTFSFSHVCLAASWRLPTANSNSKITVPRMPKITKR